MKDTSNGGALPRCWYIGAGRRGGDLKELLRLCCAKWCFFGQSEMSFLLRDNKKRPIFSVF